MNNNDLRMQKGKIVKTVLFTKMIPEKDLGNAMGPESVIKLLC